jgi:hypothetical protein
MMQLGRFRAPLMTAHWFAGLAVAIKFQGYPCLLDEIIERALKVCPR